MRDTVQQALAAVLGVSSAQQGTSPTPTPTGSAAERLKAALNDAAKAYADGESALKSGDFTAYGAAQQRLKAAIERARTAQSELK